VTPSPFQTVNPDNQDPSPCPNDSNLPVSEKCKKVRILTSFDLLLRLTDAVARHRLLARVLYVRIANLSTWLSPLSSIRLQGDILSQSQRKKARLNAVAAVVTKSGDKGNNNSEMEDTLSMQKGKKKVLLFSIFPRPSSFEFLALSPPPPTHSCCSHSAS
jgi:hypothetical protein